MKISGRFLFLQIVLLALVSAAFAQAPKTLSYQGTLSDSSGPLNGSHNLTFKIYDASSGGTALWTETNSGVAVSSGNVSITLGKIVPINIQTVKPLWMGITVDGNSEISPRVELSASLYSIGLALPYSAVESDSSALLSITNNGSGPAIHASSGGPGLALAGVTGSGWTGIYGLHYGGAGHAGKFEIQNGSNGWPALEAATAGGGNAIKGSTSTGWAAISGVSGGTGTGIHGANNGPGNGFAGLFENTSATNSYPALQASSRSGSGVRVLQGDSSLARGIDVFMTNSTTTQEGLYVNTLGLGMAANFGINNTESWSSAVQAYSTSNGVTLHSANGGLGGAGVFNIDNPTSNAPVIEINQAGSGYGIYSNGSIFVNGTIEATSFIGDGSGLSNLPAQAIALPYQASSGESGPLLGITSSGTGTAGSFVVSNTEGDQSALTASTNGVGSAAFVSNTNADNSTATLDVSSFGTGPTVSGIAYNTGPAGRFDIYSAESSSYGLVATTGSLYGGAANFFSSNADNNSPAMYVSTSGNGNAAFFGSTKVDATKAAVLVTTNAVNYPAGEFTHDGTSGSAGNAGRFRISSTTSSSAAIDVNTQGLAAAGEFFIQNSANDSWAIGAITSGTGPAALFNATNSGSTSPVLRIMGSGTGNSITADGTIQANSFVGDGSGLTGVPASLSLPLNATSSNASPLFNITSTGDGIAGLFSINNTTNNTSALAASTNGTGVAVSFYNSNPDNYNPVLDSRTNGVGPAAFFDVQNPAANTPAMSVSTNSTNSPAGSFENWGSGGSGGHAGQFSLSSPNNGSSTLLSYTLGIGAAAEFTNLNGANTSPVVIINGAGTGNSITASGTIQANAFVGDGSGLTGLPASSLSLPVNASLEDASPLFDITNTGYGIAGRFSIDNTSANTAALFASSNGGGSALTAQTTGVGYAGLFNSANVDATSPALRVISSATNSPAGSFVNNGTGGGAGQAGSFTTSSTTTESTTLGTYQMGLGPSGEFSIQNASNDSWALAAITDGTGPAFIANSNGNGRAIKIISGGLQYNVSYVTSSTSIDTRSAVYSITGGGTTFTLTYGASDGDTCIAYNGTGSPITVSGVSLATGQTRQLVYIGGWRGL